MPRECMPDNFCSMFPSSLPCPECANPPPGNSQSPSLLACPTKPESLPCPRSSRRSRKFPLQQLEPLTESSLPHSLRQFIDNIAEIQLRRFSRNRAALSHAPRHRG